MSKKVLVVDDSATDLQKLSEIISGAGYNVVTASNGNDAVAKAKQEKPDAVFLDIIMGDMNGFQVCRAITSAEETKGIPVVLVSSKKEKTDEVWGREQGARSYVTKPYTPDQILKELKTL